MSYSWRSILHGLEIMKKGMVWRIGDGSNLKIWSDPWLPRDQSRKPITPRGVSLLTYVDELINPITGTWDSELVNDTFWEDDASIILSIPVFEGWDNSLAWHFDKRGLFSVKSAYRVCRDGIIRRVTRGCAQGSSRIHPDPIWRKIWDLNFPAMIKHFVWRFTHNSQLKPAQKPTSEWTDSINEILFNSFGTGACSFTAPKILDITSIWHRLL